jgi:hypothetical protein
VLLVGGKVAEIGRASHLLSGQHSRLFDAFAAGEL